MSKFVVNSPDLAGEIEDYVAFFKSFARDYYDDHGQARMPDGHVFTSPAAAIKDAFQNPWEGSPKWEGIDVGTFLPIAEEWMAGQGMKNLSRASYGYRGWTAACFFAQTDRTSVIQIVRIGAEGGDMPHLMIPWNPLHLQPYALDVMAQGGQKMVASRGLFAPMVPPYQPEGFGDFLNKYILAGTPYAIKDHKDLSVLLDGTPIYGDPDSIGFATPELATKHANDQNDPAWRQSIMRKIHENCERIGLPSCLRCVVETGPGVFATKQSVLHPDPQENTPPIVNVTGGARKPVLK